jgi:glycosyltransferase involved in cell wall biosynthesis
MTGSPRIVFGLPAYGRPEVLARTLESLLGQTFTELAVVIVDDQPSPDVRAVVDAYASRDARLTYHANAARLGMIGNWRRAFDMARVRHPHADYFAWASDHDVWHPRWAETLVAALDDAPGAVAAYPRSLRMHPHDRRRVEGQFETAGVAAAGRRLRAVVHGITAGNAIYGLFRAEALARAGVFARVLMPDRHILLALSLLGEFRQVPDYLWYREVSPAFSQRRQRPTLFAGSAPLHSYLPLGVQHAAALLWRFGIAGAGRPQVGRLAGLWYTAVFLGASVQRRLAGPPRVRRARRAPDTAAGRA